MIIVVGGIKGGSGKTTIATNIAIMRSLDKSDVLLVDADDQETSMDFSLLRNENLDGNAGYTSTKLTGKMVRTEIIKQSKKYDDIIIDTGGRDTASQRAALTVADILLVPFVPRSFDLWTIDNVSQVVDEISTVNPNLKAYSFINKADPRGSDNEDAIDTIKETPNIEFLNLSVGNRKAFSNAAAGGVSVVELKPIDFKAVDEIRDLYNVIFNSNENKLKKYSGE